MTNDEAIQFLKQIYPYGGHCWLDEQRTEAIGKAIQALSYADVKIYIARDCDGRLYTFTKKPHLSESQQMSGVGYWHTDDGQIHKLDKDLYPEIKENECVEFVAIKKYKL
jgi:hypothetical protein